MKTLKKIALTTTLFGVITFTFIGFNNSIIVNKTAFLDNHFDIKFAKRLDEMNGEVTFGRMAASLPKFDPSKSLNAQVVEKEVKKIDTSKAVAKVSEKKKESKSKKDITMPEPSVVDARGLVLTGGLYNKRPLEKKHVFSGSASVVDGVLEDVTVSLPDGKGFSINTNDRMVGNVFQYEDTETREIKSGLFYKVNDGQYMVTLTDDTNFPGLRLEFKSEDLQESSQANWAMNEQNLGNSEDAYPQDDYAKREEQDKQAEWDTYQEEINEQAFNQEFETEGQYQGGDEIDQAFDEAEEGFDGQETVDASQTYGFNFQS